MATTSAQFSVHSVVRGHHVYKKIWTSYLGEILDLRPEVGNKYDRFITATRAQTPIYRMPYYTTNNFKIK